MASKDALIQQLEESRKNKEQWVAELGPNAKSAVTVTESESLSFDHVYQEWQRTHDQIKIAIRDLPPEKWENRSSSPGADPQCRRSGDGFHYGT